MAKPEWQSLLTSLPSIQKFLETDPCGYAMQEMVRCASLWTDRMFWAVDNHHPFVWYNLGFSPELIYGLGRGQVCPLTIEMMGVVQNLIGDIRYTMEFIDAAEAGGVPSDSCSADKMATGAILKGLYPPPACTLGINTPCDAQVISTQTMAELTGKPFFLIDVPYYYGDETIQHVADQLGRLIPFLEEHTGYRMDDGRLRHACELSNATTQALWNWLDWRKLVPLCQTSKVASFTLLVQVLFAGSPEGLVLAQALEREARERYQAKERFFEEKVRAIWYQDAVWTDMQIYDRFERDLGLTVPVDIFGYYAQEGLIDTANRSSMLFGLARKLTNCHPMGRQFRSDFSAYIKDFMDLHQAFAADCGIFAGHIACKHAWGSIGLFKEACRKADIPLLVFEFDMFDPRVTSYDDIFFEVERFVNELVLPRKRRKAQ
jgi:hypothetical protein